MSEENLICPHCESVQHTHTDDEITSDMCFTQCEYCEKHFWYGVVVTHRYSSYILMEDGREAEHG